MSDLLIDVDQAGGLKGGWSVPEGCHQKGSHFKWDASEVSLYLSEQQKNGRRIEGNKLREELAGKPAPNANVLDYLLANPHLIPEEWKGKYVFFWGTIYPNSDGRLFVRYLCWGSVGWGWGNRWLARDWDSNCPAAVPAS